VQSFVPQKTGCEGWHLGGNGSQKSRLSMFSEKEKSGENHRGKTRKKLCFPGVVAGNPFSPGNLNSHAPKLPTCHILSLALPLSLLLLRWL